MDSSSEDYFSDLSECLESEFESGSDISESSEDNVDYEKINALATHRLQVIEDLLKTDIDLIAIVNQNRQTILHRAAIASDYDLAALLIKCGAAVDSTDDKGKTPLHISSEKGDCEILSLLLENKADFDVEDDSNMTPLILAAEKGHCNVVARLLESGAIIEPGEDDDEVETTPLHKAAEEGHHMVVDLLLKNGAKAEITDSNFNSPLHLAAEAGHLKVVALLLENEAQIESTASSEGKSPLHLAAEQGHVELVDYLLKKGANIHCETEDGDSPIHLASKYGNREVVNLLLKNGAAIVSYGISALHYAVSSSALLVKDLIAAGAEVNARDACDGTPLHYASNPETIRLLISFGADIHSKDDMGFTPLHVGLFKCFTNYDAVATFLDNGADVNSKDNEGRIALHFAVSDYKEEIAALLLNRGSDVNNKDNKGRSPLHEAASCFSLSEEVLRLLIESGADIHCKDNEGKTPLHEATRYSNTGCLEFLIKRGADVHSKDNMGRPPLFGASEDCLLALIKNGADINVISGSGTVLDYARNEGRHSLDKVALLQQLLIKMKSVNMYLRKEMLQDIETKRLNGRSIEELARLKVTQIGNSNITYYKFLGKRVDQLVWTLRSKTIEDAFESGAFMTEFPNFGVVISNHYIQGSRRKKLVDKVVFNCSEVFHGLLEECVHEILSYLSNEELIRFADCFVKSNVVSSAGLVTVQKRRVQPARAAKRVST